MNLNEKDIIGTYKLNDGSKYIFLKDDVIYKEEINGQLQKIKLTPYNIKKIQNDMGQIKSDVIF